LRVRVDRGVDADDFSLDVQQGAAGVAGVDRGVGLDEVGEGAALLLRRDGAAERGDDAGRDGAAEAEGVADGDDALADHQVARGADRRGGEALRADAQHRHVAVGVDADQLRRELRAVVEVDADRRRAFDDVVVRDDDAVARPDEAGAERLRLVFAVAAEEAKGIEEGVDLTPPDGRLGLDVDDRGQDVVRDDDDGRAPRGADGLRNRRALLPRLPHGLRLGGAAGEGDDEEDDQEAKTLHGANLYERRAYWIPLRLRVIYNPTGGRGRVA